MATCPAKSDHGTSGEVSELIHSSKSEATQKQLGLTNAISWNHSLKLLYTCVWSLMYGQADVFMRSKELRIIRMPYVLAFCHWHKPTIKATWGEMSGSRLTTLRSHSTIEGSQDRTQGREREEEKTAYWFAQFFSYTPGPGLAPHAMDWPFYNLQSRKCPTFL